MRICLFKASALDGVAFRRRVQILLLTDLLLPHDARRAGSASSKSAAHHDGLHSRGPALRQPAATSRFQTRCR